MRLYREAALETSLNRRAGDWEGADGTQNLDWRLQELYFALWCVDRVHERGAQPTNNRDQTAGGRRR